MSSNYYLNSSTDSFYDISIESNSTDNSFTNRIEDVRVVNTRINIIYKYRIFFIFILFIFLLGYVIYNYCYEILRGLNKIL